MQRLDWAVCCYYINKDNRSSYNEGHLIVLTLLQKGNTGLCYCSLFFFLLPAYSFTAHIQVHIKSVMRTSRCSFFLLNLTCIATKLKVGELFQVHHLKAALQTTQETRKRMGHTTLFLLIAFCMHRLLRTFPSVKWLALLQLQPLIRIPEVMPMSSLLRSCFCKADLPACILAHHLKAFCSFGVGS